ncbi:hypothetical protein NDI47_02365 [Microcoleus vaginatus GB1-A2]|nr:hypothetical protein [Microcoleus sp. FACHB-61]
MSLYSASFTGVPGRQQRALSARTHQPRRVRTEHQSPCRVHSTHITRIWNDKSRFEVTTGGSRSHNSPIASRKF